MKEAYRKAEKILSENVQKLHELAKYLYEEETITGDEFMEILNRPAESIAEQPAESIAEQSVENAAEQPAESAADRPDSGEEPEKEDEQTPADGTGIKTAEATAEVSAGQMNPEARTAGEGFDKLPEN